jgi:hypothetical protein
MIIFKEVSPYMHQETDRLRKKLINLKLNHAILTSLVNELLRKTWPFVLPD